MEFTVTHTGEQLPRNCKRSARLRKKLRVKEFQEVLFEIVLKHKGDIVMDDDKFDAVLDYLYDDLKANPPFVGLRPYQTSLLVLKHFSGSVEERVAYAEDLARSLQEGMAKHWEIYADVSECEILIGDSTYGNW